MQGDDASGGDQFYQITPVNFDGFFFPKQIDHQTQNGDEHAQPNQLTGLYGDEFS
jgi:hypothetical protein